MVRVYRFRLCESRRFMIPDPDPLHLTRDGAEETMGSLGDHGSRGRFRGVGRLGAVQRRLDAGHDREHEDENERHET